MKKKGVEFEDVQPQSIPNPTQENFPRRLPDGVSHIYYTGKKLMNRDSMRVHGTFTTVFKVWKDIATIPAVRGAVVNIFGQFMEIHLDSTQVPYDDTWSILSNARQLLPNIDFSHIKSGNVSIAHLRMYLTITADQEDDITIACAFIFFMIGHLWFQTANDTVPLGYLTAVNDFDSAAQYDWGSAILASLYHGLDTAVTTGGAITGFVQLLPYWFYEYCGVGHPIVKEEVKYPVYPRLKAWKRGNRRKTNDQAANLFIIGRYHIDNRTVETITWEPWFNSAVSETEDVLNTKLISRKRMPLQVPNGNYEYYLGDRCWRQVTGEVCIPLDPPLSMLPNISPAALHEMRQAEFVDCEQFVVGEERETYATYWAKQTSEELYLGVGILTFVTTQSSSPPKKFLLPWLVGGFVMSMSRSYLTAQELVALLVSCGYILGISPSILGHQREYFWRHSRGIFSISSIDVMSAMDESTSNDPNATVNSDWKKLKALHTFLEEFYKLTKRVSGSKYVTSNTYFDELAQVKDLLIDNLTNDDVDFREMAMKMDAKFDKYCNFDSLNLILVVAIIPDPRYKMKYAEFWYSSYLEKVNYLGEEEKSDQVVSFIEKLKDLMSHLYNHYKLEDASIRDVNAFSTQEAINNLVENAYKRPKAKELFRGILKQKRQYGCPE
ncbi:hypothetical protein GIB67_032267 [Kingdonia uniflora]|uniref:Aminotransferase-like plant mobile domain-containing protein n=1 Tax=Kingdonia uniflora TaxID=39325 RepID=A0A7J7MX82_9MAGN|nr:hypothetical protein GIB67_032267 [Kingdonia uniflora]